MTSSVRLNKLIIGLFDGLIYIASFLLAFILRYGIHHQPWYNWHAFLIMLPWFIIVFYGLAVIYNYYSEYSKYDEILISIIWIIILGTIIDIALSFLFRQFAVPRTIFVISAIIQFTLLGIWRYVVWNKALVVKNPRSALAIGNAAEIENLVNSINVSLSSGLCIKKKLLRNSLDDFDKQWKVFINSKFAEEAEIFLICSSIPISERKAIISYAVENEKKVMLVPGIYDILLQNAHLVSAGDVPLIQLNGLLDVQPFDYAKRLIDVVLSAIALIILLPFSLLISLAIKLDSPGPIFYFQTRTGLKGKTFEVIKFRTMVTDAEKHSGPILAAEKDPRITRVGGFLRKTRFDEVPQFWNVLRGDMSLVGPRPERPFFVEEFSEELPEFEYRHLIKGGITGLAQVEGKYSIQAKNKLNYDLIYAQNKSIWVDLLIILRTAKAILQKGKAS